MAVELATAYVSLVASAKGIQKSVTSELSGVESEAEKAGERSGGRFSGAFGKAAKVAAGASVAAGAAIGGLVAKGVSDFAAFERQMNEVFTLMPGISGEAMNAMQGQVKDFSKEFGVLPNEVVPALYQSLSAGVPADNVFEFMEVAQKAAKGGVAELSTAVDGISSVVNAYGSDVLGATEASDLMFTAVRLGKTNFDELSASLFQVTPTASALGVQFADVTAGLANLTAQGVPTSVATTQMRQLFVELSKEGGKAAKTFEEMAGKTFQDFIAEGGNTADALDLMLKASEKSGTALQDMFGSVEAGSAALALADGGTDAYRATLDEMAGSAGATDAAFEQMNSGLGPLIDRIKAGLAVALIDIGERAAPYVEKALDRLVEVFNSLSAWWDRNGPAITAAVSSVFGSLGDTIERLRPPLRDFVDNVLTSLSEWWSDNRTKIIAAAEALRDAIERAFSAIGSAAQFVIDNWERFRTVVIVAAALMVPHFVALGVAATVSAAKQAAAWVVTQAGAIKAAVVHSAQVAFMVARWAFVGVQSLIHAAKVAAAWLIAMGPIGLVIAAVAGLVALIIIYWDDIKRIISAGWNWVSRKTTELWNGLTSWLSRTWDDIVTKVKEVWRTITRWIDDRWEDIKRLTTNAINDVVQWFKELPGRLIAAVKEKIQDLIALGRWVIEQILDGIKVLAEGAGGLFSWFIGLPQKLFDNVVEGARVLLNIGKTIVEKIVEGIKEVAEDIGGAILGAIPGGGAISSVIGKIPNPFGDGPGRPLPGGGSALERVQRAISGTRARITSTYRSPEHNRRVGGAPRSYHMDRNNPAVDIVAPTAAELDAIYARLRAMGGWRELLWRVPNHAPGDNMHIHAAHSGDYVKPSSPGWVPGLAKDERLRALQVGEVVLPKHLVENGMGGPRIAIDEVIVNDGRDFIREMEIQNRLYGG